MTHTIRDLGGVPWLFVGECPCAALVGDAAQAVLACAASLATLQGRSLEFYLAGVAQGVRLATQVIGAEIAERSREEHDSACVQGAASRPALRLIEGGAE